MQDTELRVDVHHRGRVHEVELTDNYSSGRWKLISLSKRGGRLTLSVDGGAKTATLKVHKKLHLGRILWLGGSKEATAPEVTDKTVGAAYTVQ